MKIICFSDLHLEFEEPFTPPAEDIADVMILAGDIITFSDFTPFEQIVKAWRKPILFITGNHEFYPLRTGAFECKGYDDQGMVIEV
jgi:predicted phosphodiesterase|tara:strand:- start:1172 stop:1429 length:258 start_codon:yes stop_codon:yes gene_type:complete